MRTDRLLKLADFLETVPPEAFDIVTWVSSEQSKPEGERPGDCGFAGCAIGWAAHAKLFDGLTLSGRSPRYQYEVGFQAVDTLFEFEEMEGDPGAKLFYFSSYPAPHKPTPKQVAERIREFVTANPVSP